MNENVGEELKTWAKILYIVTVVVFIIIALYLFSSAQSSYAPALYSISGMITVLVGLVIAKVEMLLLYGFGVLVENSFIPNRNGQSQITLQKPEDEH